MEYDFLYDIGHKVIDDKRNLIITERAEELLDNLVYHLIYRLKNTQAAGHLMNNISAVYDRLEENPYQFPECRLGDGFKAQSSGLYRKWISQRHL